MKKPKNIWTPAEIKILCTVYAEQGGDEAIKHLPGRTKQAIYTKVHDLGIKFRMPVEKREPTRTIHVWTSPEIGWLKGNYASLGPSLWAVHLDMTKKAVVSKAARLSLRFAKCGRKKLPPKPAPIVFKVGPDISGQMIQKRTASGSWKADNVPAIRSVFDMGVCA